MSDTHGRVNARIREHIIQHGEEPELMRVTAEEYADLYMSDCIDRFGPISKGGCQEGKFYKGIELQVLTDQPLAA